jgi:hypothetical protein
VSDAPVFRVCSRCHVAKPLADFPIKNTAKGWYGSHCRTCRRSYGKKHYLSNVSYYKAKASVSRTRERSANRAIVDAFLADHPCVECGEADPVVLDFDHVDPKLKVDAIGRLQHSGGRAVLLSEMSKCEVRCGNCHRRRTARQFGWYRVSLAAHD